MNYANYLLNSLQISSKKDYVEKGQTKFIDPFTILALNYDDPNEMKKLLLSPEERFYFFIKVYGKVIYLKEVSDKEGKEICKVFQDFIKAAFIYFKSYYPLMILLYRIFMLLMLIVLQQTKI